MEVKDTVVNMEGSSKGSSTTFMKLPVTTRCRIYCHYAHDAESVDSSRSNVPRFPSIWRHIFAVGAREAKLFLYASNYDGNSLVLLQSYNHLRLINRTANAEIIAFLCARYRILLHADILSQLGLLYSSGWLHHMRYIIIDFCHQLCIRVECTETRRRCPENGREPCRDSYCRKFKHYLTYERELVFHAALRGWQDLAKHLASISTENLQIGLYHFTDDSYKALSLVEPLAQLSVRRCLVKLGYCDTTSRLLTIARRGVQSCTSDWIRKEQTFRFLDLPAELRAHILSFTDLITPLRQVHRTVDNKYRLPPWGREAHCNMDPFCTNGERVSYPPCSCFVEPSPFFSVCRAIHEDAKRVFFRSNRFIIDCWEPGKSVCRRRRDMPFEIATFFNIVASQGCLHHLRDVEIIFSPLAYGPPGIDSVLLQDWQRQISVFAPSLDGLSLTVHAGMTMTWTDEVRTADSYVARQALFEVHKQLLLPLQQLRSQLKAFYAVVEAPYVGSMTSREARSEEELSAWHVMELEHEKFLETLVMGDGYDSAAQGKLQRWQSRWHDIHDAGIASRDFEDPGL